LTFGIEYFYSFEKDGLIIDSVETEKLNSVILGMVAQRDLDIIKNRFDELKTVLGLSNEEPITEREEPNRFDEHSTALEILLGKPLDGDLIRNASDEEYNDILETFADYFYQKRLVDARRSKLEEEEYFFVLGIIGTHFEKQRLEEGREYDAATEYRKVNNAVEKYMVQQRGKEARHYGEEFRHFLSLTPDDEIPWIFINGRASPEGVEAQNQFKLYRIKKELEKAQKTISEIGSPELWEIQIEYRPPYYHVGEEELKYTFLYNQIYYQRIDFDIPNMFVITSISEGAFHEVKNWGALKVINQFIVELRNQSIISDKETLDFYIGYYEQHIFLRTTEEINTFLNEIQKLETTQEKNDYLEKYR
jgi:hypothetical protein